MKANNTQPPNIRALASLASNISVAEAIATIEAQAPVMAVEEASLLQAYGRTLAEDVRSLVDHPSCDNSALDGFACRAADTLHASAETPVRLELVGQVPAGSVYDGELSAGQAVAIYTGAPMPAGADAIIAVENSARQEDQVLLYRPASPDDIRKRGQDLQAGELVLKQGCWLEPAAVGVAASMGYPRLPVVRKPRIAVLATGDEVIEPGETIRDGQVYNSNSYSVTGLLEQAGAEVLLLPRAVDDPEALRQALSSHGGVDLLMTSGGVSMGDYDFVRDLLFGEGEVLFWKVAMRPGGPVLFGRWQGLSVLGLPGNPVSSMVVTLLLAVPWVYRALGSSRVIPYQRRVLALADSDFKGAANKETLRRGRLHFDAELRSYRIASTGNQSSGILTSMLHANALTVIPANEEIKQGQTVEVIVL